MFAFEHYGVRPDVLTLAKALGGGVPIGVALATEDAAQAFEPGVHGTTFGGNPFACKVAGAVLDVVEAENLLAAAESRGRRLKAELERLAGVAEVRGLGLMLGVELDGVDARAVMTACFERGLLLNAVGDSVLRLLPPLVITDEDVDEAVGVIGEALRAVREAGS